MTLPTINELISRWDVEWISVKFGDSRTIIRCDILPHPKGRGILGTNYKMKWLKKEILYWENAAEFGVGIDKLYREELEEYAKAFRDAYEIGVVERI